MNFYHLSTTNYVKTTVILKVYVEAFIVKIMI
jgi:hypothetical protein